MWNRWRLFQWSNKSIARREHTHTHTTILPDTVQDPSIWEDSHVDIGHNDVVEVSLAFVGEKQVRHPHFTRIVESEIFHPTWKQNHKQQTQAIY